MPIRSPKGRGAAYRALWQWPLRTPARLAGCLLALLVIGIGVNAAVGHLGWRFGGSVGAAAGSPSGVATGSGGAAAPRPAAPNAPTRLPPVPELTPAALPPAQAAPAALTTATRWAKAWAKHSAGESAQTWVEGLRPWTTEEFLATLSTVDPANVPSSRVTGAARAVTAAPHSVRVEVPTDAVTLLVLVVDTGSQASPEWRVAGYDRASSAPRPPTPGQ